MFLINGVCQDSLAVNDRAIQFGDGCFTTACVVQGDIQLLKAHLARLREACERLFIPFTGWEMLEAEFHQLAANRASAVIKAIVSRGGGGRGYSPTACCSPSRILSVSDYPTVYAHWRESGISLTLSPVRLGRNPCLAGIKHLNRLEQVLIRRHLEQSGADDALVLDSDGWVTECCAANLFWCKGKQVFTPYVDQAGVNGLMRQHIMACLRRSDWQFCEVRETMNALINADEVFICNTLMPIIPVRALHNRIFTSREVYHFLAPLCESLIP